LTEFTSPYAVNKDFNAHTHTYMFVSCAWASIQKMKKNILGFSRL